MKSKAPNLDDPLFKEFEKALWEYYRLVGPTAPFELDRTELAKLFWSYLPEVIHSPIPGVSEDELLPLIRFGDTEEAYHFGGDKRNIASGLERAFTQAINHVGLSDYAKQKRAEARKKSPKLKPKRRKQKKKSKRTEAQISKDWKKKLESKPSFTIVEAATEIAFESEKSLRNKIDKPNRPGPLKLNKQGRITQASLKDYLLKEKKYPPAE